MAGVCRLATVIRGGCVYEVWIDRVPPEGLSDRVCKALAGKPPGEPIVLGGDLRVVMTHSAVTPEVVEKLRAALGQRHVGPGLDSATSRGYADVVKDVGFAADDAAYTTQAVADFFRDDIARSFAPEIVAALYPPPDEPDEPHVVTT
ncbi:MAG TPA: hypothetical protein VM529_04395 [Gemmata sp.]|nr:hypothetical protein [Gemmata sp.]